jgi:hypothetical protein
MKTLFVALVALLFAFFLGCQSSITDPELLEPTKFIGTYEDNSMDKDWFTVQYPNAIKLEGSMFDPSHNNYAAIEGVVRYGSKQVNIGSSGESIEDFYKVKPSGISPDKRLKFNLYVDAVLKAYCPVHNHPWTVKKASEQIVTVSPSNPSVIYIEKSFRVKNTCCAALDLVLKFEVFERELKLVSMQLKLVPGQLPIIVQQ